MLFSFKAIQIPPTRGTRISYSSLLTIVYWSDYVHPLTSSITSLSSSTHKLKLHNRKPYLRSSPLHLHTQLLNWVALTNPVLLMCHESSAEQKWHFGAWLWMIMWQVTMLLSHWDQISQVSGAFGTLEASWVHWPPPSHPSSTPYSPLPTPLYRSHLGDRINPQPPHTWLVTLSESCLKIALSFSNILQHSLCYTSGFQSYL